MKTTKITSMTVEEIQAATNALKQVRQAMPFILPLTPAERDACGRLGTKSAANTQMRLALVREHKDSLPPSFDLRLFEQEAALFTALSECLDTIGDIQADVRDTFLAIGRTAVQSSRIAYGHLQVGALATDNLKTSVRLLSRKRVRKPHSAQPSPAQPAAASAQSENQAA